MHVDMSHCEYACQHIYCKLGWYSKLYPVCVCVGRGGGGNSSPKMSPSPPKKYVYSILSQILVECTVASPDMMYKLTLSPYPHFTHTSPPMQSPRLHLPHPRASPSPPHSSPSNGVPFLTSTSTVSSSSTWWMSRRSSQTPPLPSTLCGQASMLGPCTLTTGTVAK